LAFSAVVHKKAMSVKSILRIPAFILLVLVLYGAMMFIPAGTIYWPDAWFYLLTQIAIMGVIASWLAKHNPGLLKERMKMGGKGVKGWDRVITSLFLVLVIAFFVVVAEDVKNGWSFVPIYIKALGYAGLFFTMGIMFWAMRVNSFLARTVKIQKDRKQKTVDSGPYAIVRHPMYAGFLCYLPSISLMLGSLYGLFVAAAFEIVLITRTYLEDKTLQKELGGYKEYTKKTRYRLVPKVW